MLARVSKVCEVGKVGGVSEVAVFGEVGEVADVGGMGEVSEVGEVSNVGKIGEVGEQRLEMEFLYKEFLMCQTTQTTSFYPLISFVLSCRELRIV